MKRIKERIQTYEFNPENNEASKLTRLINIIKEIKNEHTLIKQTVDELKAKVDKTEEEILSTVNKNIDNLQQEVHEALENVLKVIENHKQTIDSLLNINVDI